MPQPNPPLTLRPSRISAIHGTLLLAALFLVVLGSRLWLIEDFGTSLPFADQWNAEGTGLLKPWIEGQWTFSSLFAPHNEHRIVLTRLLTLALFEANGQWDAQVEMAVNAAICGVIAMLITATAWRVFPRSFRWPVLLAVIAVFALPYAWENTISGFQSQFYFLLLFSLIALWGLGFHPGFTCGWWMGAAALVLACLSMASGFFVAAPLLLLQAARTLKQKRRPGSGELAMAALCLAAIVAGLLTRTTVPGHAVLKAGSLSTFVSAFLHSVAWPFCIIPALALIMQTPLIILALAYCKQPLERWKPETWKQLEITLATGAWCLLQAAAIALARGAGGGPPSARYMDLLALGAMTNFIALLLLAFELSPAKWARPFAIFASGWTVLVVTGLVLLTESTLTGDLLSRHYANRVAEENVRGYLETKDFHQFLEGRKDLEIPYPDAAVLAKMLNDETLRGILPDSVRLPLDIEASGMISTNGFIAGTSNQEAPKPALPWWTSRLPGAEIQTEGEFHGLVKKSAGLPFWRIRFAGNMGRSGLSFEIRNRSGATVSRFTQERSGSERWRGADLSVPTDLPLEIVATDHNASGWMAFTAPVEMGRLTRWTDFILRRGKFLFWTGIAGIACLGLWSFLFKRRAR